MEINLQEVLNEMIERNNRPTEKDRITALENAITDLAMMIVGVEDND